MLQKEPESEVISKTVYTTCSGTGFEPFGLAEPIIHLGLPENEQELVGWA